MTRTDRREERNGARKIFPLTHERLSRLVIGVVTLAALTVGHWVTPWAYLVLVGMSINLIQFAFTGRCKMKDLLDRLGVPYERIETPPDSLTTPGPVDISSPRAESTPVVRSPGAMAPAWSGKTSLESFEV